MANEDTTADTTSDTPAAVARSIATQELPRLRQRGLRDLDLKDSRRSPVSCPHIERMATAFAEEHDESPSSRPARIAFFLDHALADYEKQDASSAIFVRSLFFSPTDAAVPLSPGNLLDLAREQSGLSDPVDTGRFDRLRRKEFVNFASFLTEETKGETPQEMPSDSGERKPYKFRRKPKTLLPRYVSVAISTAIVVLAIGSYLVYQMLKDDPILFKLAEKNLDPYQWPDRSALPYDIDHRPEVGQYVEAQCKYTIKQPDGTAIYWIKIKTQPWAGSWAPAASFEHGTELAKHEPECDMKG